MLVSPSSSLSTPSVHFSNPPSYLFKFPPEPLPSTLPPPVKDHSLANPFTIPTDVYNNALSVWIPISIAIVYATTVYFLNQVNRKRSYKPYGFSKLKPFFVLVILHNVFLAVFSAWVFVGMINAVVASWPGWEGEYGLAAAVDSMCKINGPRGLGDAATYNSSSGAWQLTNRALHLAADGLTPDSTDVGRIWNEGLAFYGWLFYLSKFYEVLDTAIILAKGKRSSMLQTYHHAGAMLSVWAGIRYMAPPIWMFVLVNAGIHALMYTYFTITALSYRVPGAIKRTLTSLQIAQFVVGVSFAVAHLFVTYDVPVSIPYMFTLENLSSAIPAAASTASSAIASATASAGVATYLKKLAFRAAGAEGLAENVRNAEGETFGVDAAHAIEDARAREEIRYRPGYQTIQCMDTSGQAFAIYLNIIYLLPLTGLFIRFFIKSYLKRIQSGEPSKSRPVVENAGKDAWKGLSQEFMDAVDSMHGSDNVEEHSSPPGGSNGNAEGRPVKKEEDPASSFPSSESKESDTAAENKESVTPSDKQESETPSDKQESETPSDEKKSETPSDRKESETPSDKKDSNTPSDKKEEGVPKEGMEEDALNDESEVDTDATKNEASADGETEKEASAYEASVDDVMDEEDKEVEKEMQS